MPEEIRLEVKLTGYVRRDGRKWTAVCPAVGVASQGRDRADAERCLQQAVELWIDSCVERGTLDQALRECGFRPVGWEEPSSAAVGERVTVERRSVALEVLGSEFDVEVSVPAYQAAHLLDGGAGSSPA